jgi:hypothetical protein
MKGAVLGFWFVVQVMAIKKSDLYSSSGLGLV